MLHVIQNNMWYKHRSKGKVVSVVVKVYSYRGMAVKTEELRTRLK